MAPQEKGREVSSLRAKVDAAQRQMHEMAIAPLFAEQLEDQSVKLQSRRFFVNFEHGALDDSMLYAKQVSGKTRVQRPPYEKGPFCRSLGSQRQCGPTKTRVEAL